MSEVVEPLVSCLCVTEERPAFMPWLLWCFERQSWPRRELIIVDSSAKPLQVRPERENVRVLTAQPGANVAKKRNVALQAARGEIITWFDDDDWQHPHKLAWLVEALRKGAPYAGSRHGWFLDLTGLRCAPHRAPRRRIVFNSAGFQREAALSVRFDENLRKASDSRWMQELDARFRGQAVFLDRQDTFFWLCHESNISNPAGRRSFTQPLDALKEQIGAKAWGDSDDALQALKQRLQDQLEPSKPRAKVQDVVQVKPPQPKKRAEDDRTEAHPPVGVMIKATVMDAPFLDVVVRHMIAQAQYPFVERAIIVERQPAFSGKYRTRPQASNGKLDQVLAQLKTDGVVDHVRDVDMDSTVVRGIMERYFARSARRVPTHAITGGPIYATLFGLESMSTDYVLQMDADIFFYTGPSSWVSQSLDCMAGDPRLWLMMTHPGPPVGAPGESLGGRNARHATWDAQLGIWRFRHATTRYFLCDRRKLHRRLQPRLHAQGCAPLEQCISASLQKYGAFRGNLGDLESWHLHAWHHGAPFPQWATLLAQAVKAGRYPSAQKGEYDLRLDRHDVLREWTAILEQMEPQGDMAIPAPTGRRMQKAARRKTNGRERELAGLASHRDFGERAPIAVVIPIRDRAGQRVLNTLRGLNWQTTGSPAQVLVVSQGSQADIDRELEDICRQESATLITQGSPSQPWNKSLALNTGIRTASPELPYVMTMDADMILSPNFLQVVLEHLERDPPALVLCRISDVPQQVSLPRSRKELLEDWTRLHTMTRLRKRAGSGGIQAACRSFFFEIRGYDEDLLWWGAMDGDILKRAQLVGLQLEWIEEQTAMLHQWHPRKHQVLTDRREIEQARQYWRRNHQLVQSRARIACRNPKGWGGVRG